MRGQESCRTLGRRRWWAQSRRTCAAPGPSSLAPRLAAEGALDDTALKVLLARALPERRELEEEQRKSEEEAKLRKQERRQRGGRRWPRSSLALLDTPAERRSAQLVSRINALIELDEDEAATASSSSQPGRRKRKKRRKRRTRRTVEGLPEENRISGR